MLLLPGGLLFLIVFFLAIFMVRIIISYASKNNILDQPNSRSLHDRPVPRGGGISIVLPVLTCLVVMWGLNYISPMAMAAFLIGGLLIFLIGVTDDLKSLPVLIKGVVYFVSAMWGVVWISIDTAGIASVNIWSVLIWSLFISWMINLYNFMDGSDGLAGMQAVLAALILVVIAAISEFEFLYYLMLVIAASAAGFLFYNYPSAKIFMGDSGSCFLGFIFGLGGYYSYMSNAIEPEVWLILFSIFICDASLTLLMRLFSGQKWHEAHRQHAYQKWILMQKSHKNLLIWFVILFVLFLLPIMILSITIKVYAWYFVLFCYGVLAIIWAVIQYRYRSNMQVN